MLTSSELTFLTKSLVKGTKVVISTHKSPDGDAIGSSSALGLFLAKLGCQCTVIVPDAFPEFLSWIPGNELIIVNDDNPEKAEKAVADAEIIFSLDYNDTRRAGHVGLYIDNSEVTKVMIDHHEEPTGFASINYHDASCCSTAQLVYDFIEELGQLALLDPSIGAGIYTGIITDTGSLRYPSVTARTHDIISGLIKNGLEHFKVHEALFDDNSVSRLQLNGYAVSEKLELLQNGNVAVIHLEESELIRFNARKGDTEGLVNKALSISGVNIAVFFRQHGDMIKISFRSKGNFYVNELARDHFNGGGHKYAAGGMSMEGIQAAISKFKEVVPDYV